ncbi:efflux transporter outer membrane subunit [Sphingomonas sp. AP4-R1]|uniref:efflux transporter outer membrane subunit n=1 Tax=Sphingomonas sp. AP4-R1 TaxID=2735134 RepID=UPI0014933B81|nr:efflux transporter outer membrane subunit [Sphingomonas sp. AP4-R1]QJU57724.1 efflux transporter outer membrane subunit [Sphingomonas sp. AP4-R1]
MAKRLIAVLLGAAALGGCSFAPPYKPPVAPAPPAFKEAGPWQPAQPAAASAAPADWWSMFGDAQLGALEAKIASDNPTLAGALGRYDQARAYLSQARAGLFPEVGVGADLTRNRQSDNRPLRGQTQPDYYSSATVAGDFGYELDLWGRVRNSVRAGKAEAEASGDDAAALKLSLESELATTYFALRGYDQQIKLLAATIDAYAQADTITRHRFEGGIANALDAGRSGAQLAEAQAQLEDVKAARALAEHAIASLIGMPASSFSIAASDDAITLPGVPALLPSTLLERRPDVAAAERRMAAANAAIGVTKAAFFPAITLGGQGGYQNTGIPGLMTAPNILWSIGPSAVLNLFDGGRRRAQVRVARARWAQATADYRGQVLTAFQEVEDNLSQLHYLGTEAEAENRAVEQAAIAEQTAVNRFSKGAVNYLDVVTAQTVALRVRRTAIELRTRQLQASVKLTRATGGGWQPGQPLKN